MAARLRGPTCFRAGRVIVLTHFVKADLDAVREALAQHKERSWRVDTPDGYERLETVIVPHTPHTGGSEHYWPPTVTMLLQYWCQHGHICRFRNYTSFEEWRNDL